MGAAGAQTLERATVGPPRKPDRHAPSPVTVVSSGFSPAWLRERALDSYRDATVARRLAGGFGPLEGRPRFMRQRRRTLGFTLHITADTQWQPRDP